MGYETPANRSRRILKRIRKDPLMTKKTDDRMEFNDNLLLTSDDEPLLTGCEEQAKDMGVQTYFETVSSSTQWSDESLQDHIYVQVSANSNSNSDASTQTQSTSHVSKGVNCSTTHINMSCEKLNSDSLSHLYTGLCLQAFITLLNIFQNLELPFKFTMNVGDQLLLFLMRLRLNLLFADLGHWFGISESQASKIFNC
ncbi:uncharacterized protein LOC132543899 [Ylistrum balloti]|uniref:uncharacterized protein LOC132543899 n=1 Tax=Ylistrum balloti TaxID=509963 RepID=UPI0029058707|nr:uncharacterized protein LOC132543899 [Ylistrum balloti]